MIAIALIALTVWLGVLTVLFFFQEKRQKFFLAQIEGLLERLSTAEANAKVLSQNDATLLKDIKMMLHEFKSIEKKVKHPHR